MPADDDFRFSPRANRAHEIAWRPWGDEAFAESASSGKPILLSLSAVWCHWCHVMDETTYSNADVIATINADYVPVRVDNDRRPDINRRYNMGGWPSTGFLTASGEVITGATYIPPHAMLDALHRVTEYYRSRRPTTGAPNGAERPGRRRAGGSSQSNGEQRTLRTRPPPTGCSLTCSMRSIRCTAASGQSPSSRRPMRSGCCCSGRAPVATSGSTK